MNTSTVIVGGGLGGLSAAIHLAARGQQVVLLEKNARVGGKLNIIEDSGYRFDTGPSLLTMPWILRELYKTAGEHLEDHLTITPVDPICRYRWQDGTTFDTWQSSPQLLAEITRLDPRDVAGYLRFMAYASRIYQSVAHPFLLNPFNGVRDLLTPQLLTDALRIDPFRTVDQAVRSFFHSPYLRQVFNRYATYNGSSPFEAPATFNLISYVEFAWGGWHVAGGMYEIARALEQLARRLGVDIRTNTTVERIVATSHRVNGVVAGGEHIPTDTVVVNADPRYTFEALLPEYAQERARLQQLELSYSGFVLMLGVDRIYPSLQHHNIFFSNDYRDEFRTIVTKRQPATDPTIYVCAPSVTDPHVAPAGHMNLFILINAPTVHPGLDWGRIAPGYRDLVIAALEQAGLTELNRHITVEHMLTPADLQARYNAPGGSIYGLASNQPWTAFLRPTPRSRAVRGLYFVGGGTHPGGGIPLVLLSGRSTASHVLADHKRRN